MARDSTGRFSLRAGSSWTMAASYTGYLVRHAHSGIATPLLLHNNGGLLLCTQWHSQGIGSFALHAHNFAAASASCAMSHAHMDYLKRWLCQLIL